MSKSAKRHLDDVSGLGCLLCQRLGYGPTPAEIHHVREGQGMSQRASDWLAIPLCPGCHRGPMGVHGDRRLLEIARTDEMDLLAETIERLRRAA